MRVDRILAEERPVFSFEFFAPKTDQARRTLEGTLEVLKDDRPDDVSVTYGRVAPTGERTVVHTLPRTRSEPTRPLTSPCIWTVPSTVPGGAKKTQWPEASYGVVKQRRARERTVGPSATAVGDFRWCPAVAGHVDRRVRQTIGE